LSQFHECGLAFKQHDTKRAIPLSQTEPHRSNTRPEVQHEARNWHCRGESRQQQRIDVEAKAFSRLKKRWRALNHLIFGN